jgi:hypothetical protein
MSTVPDREQPGPVPPRSRTATFFGVDGSGLVSIYFPLGGVEPVPFDPKEHLLPGAIQLDATPGDEKFYAFYAPTPFALDAVKRAVTQNGSLPPGVMKAEVVLKKKVAP